jgi:hypothetical protein
MVSSSLPLFSSNFPSEAIRIGIGVPLDDGWHHNGRCPNGHMMGVRVAPPGDGFSEPREVKPWRSHQLADGYYSNKLSLFDAFFNQALPSGTKSYR